MTANTHTRVHPVTLEVIRNALPAISNEMSADFQRASYNMMIYEVRDYCCAVVGVDGALWSQNVGGVSHFVADLGVVIEDAVARYGADGFAPGDVLITNHQAIAGQHLNNMVVHMPVFVAGNVVCFTVVRAHWVDVGGLSVTLDGVADPWMEGFQLDQLKVHQAGEANETLMSLIRTNVRFPDATLGDLRSQIAACRLGAQRVQELYGRYGGEVVEAAVDRIFADSEERCRNAVVGIPDGIYRASSLIDDDDGPTDEPIDLNVVVTVAGGDMTVDFSECSPQRNGPANARTYAGARVAYKCITAPGEAVNEGSFRALNVVIPEGNIMMARFPAPMGAWSKVLPTVIDTVLLALAPAMPGQVPAAHLGYLGGLLLYTGFDETAREHFIVQSIEGGGWGGRPHEDGASASVSICQGDVQNAPIETVELRGPVVIEERALRPDSAGVGQYRGGFGVQVRARALAPGRWRAFRDGRRQCPPWGLVGGGPGASAEFHFAADGENFEELSSFGAPGLAGARVLMRSAGGGGWGDPRKRDPRQVLRDVRDGLVSIESAEHDYGVAINSERLVIDEERTSKLRAT